TRSAWPIPRPRPPRRSRVRSVWSAGSGRDGRRVRGAGAAAPGLRDDLLPLRRVGRSRGRAGPGAPESTPGSDAAPMSRITAAEVVAALEITRVAYQEAMSRAGMLAGKIAEVRAYAESQLAELADQDDDADPAP